MGYFDSQFITDEGSALLAKSTAGEGEIIFTAIHTGDGDYNMQEISRITSRKALKNEKQVFFVNDIDSREKDTRIRAVITNHELSEGYYIREAGLYARMDGEEEILFSISVCIEKPTFLPAMGDVPIEMPVTNHITYSGDGNFTIEYRSDVYASLEMVNRIFDGLKKDIHNNKSELNIHVNNSAVHFTETERDKLSGIAAEANKYIHPASAAGAKTSGLYKITTDANGHVTGATAVVKKDITDLGIPASDTNTTYGTGTASAAGLTKLYTSTGVGTDGTMTRSAITAELGNLISVSTITCNKITLLGHYDGSSTTPIPKEAGYYPIACIPVNAGFTDICWIQCEISGDNIITRVKNTVDGSRVATPIVEIIWLKTITIKK